MKTGISTIIITLNEEHNIERCIKSVLPFSDEVIVVDSHSTDRTVERAKALTPHVFVQQWLGYAGQKKWALNKVTNQWVFWIDADEEASPELQQEIAQLTFDCDGYKVPRKVWYCNRWITHCGWYPQHVLRLFNHEAGSFNDNIVHESFSINGTTKLLHHPLFHYTYRDISHHLTKINEFTTLAAKQLHVRGKKSRPLTMLLRPPFHFFKSFIIKQGFKDGTAGFVVCVLGSVYAFLKYAKLWECSLSKNSGSK